MSRVGDVTGRRAAAWAAKWIRRTVSALRVAVLLSLRRGTAVHCSRRGRPPGEFI